MSSAVTWFGDRAVQVALPDPDLRLTMLAALRAAFPDLDVRPGLETVLVAAPEPDPGLRDRVVARVEAGAAGVAVTGNAPVVDIPVSYDGADLPGTAAMLGCSVETLVRAHGDQQWTVAMMGFAPGFGYLLPVGPARLPWERVSRLERPRARVPQGSVALAAGMSAVYPAAMPGGWRLIGTSTVALFDPDAAAAPALLSPGARVRFRQAAR